MVSKRYGHRPSTLLGLDPNDPVALDLDIAIALRGLYAESASGRNEDAPRDSVDAEYLTAIVGS